jgi:hypothetical protein
MDFKVVGADGVLSKQQLTGIAASLSDLDAMLQKTEIEVRAVMEATEAAVGKLWDALPGSMGELVSRVSTDILVTITFRLAVWALLTDRPDRNGNDRTKEAARELCEDVLYKAFRAKAVAELAGSDLASSVDRYGLAFFRDATNSRQPAKRRALVREAELAARADQDAADGSAGAASDQPTTLPWAALFAAFCRCHQASNTGRLVEGGLGGGG